MRILLLRAVLALLSLAASASAASPTPWRSVLYPEIGYDPAKANLETEKVLQDFSYAGYHSGAIAIPEISGPVIDVTATPFSADASGHTDATVAIQSAINAAGNAGGGVVFLPAGTYRLSFAPGANQALLLDRPGVVLRGAGRGRTFLLNTTVHDLRYKAAIRISGPWNSAFKSKGTATTLLSHDVLNSTYYIPVEDSSLFAVGDTVIVRNNITDDWITEHGEPDWLGKGENLGGLLYRRTLLAVDSQTSTLTLDAPIHYALKVRDAARVIRLAQAPIAEVGLEDFSIGDLQHPGNDWSEVANSVEGTSAYEINGYFSIAMDRARDCWIRRVASYQAPENTSTAHLLSCGIGLRESSRITVADCIFQRPQYGGGGGNGYMYRLSNTNECLLLRCEAHFSRHGFVFSGFGCSGNVLHACLDSKTGRATGSTGYYATGGKGSDHHMHFSQANLIDCCVADESWFEARYRPYGTNPRHNITAAHSVFWNTRGTGTGNEPVVRSEQARYGYVIGTSGERAAVELPRRAPAGTDPKDHVEGEGRGESLVPRSLFLDQRLHRLGPDAPKL